MRRLPFLILLLGLALSSARAQQPVSLSPNNGLPVSLLNQVQKHAAASSGSVASLANAFSNNVTAGNSLVVSFCNGNNNAPTAPITDTLSSTWTKAAHVVNGSAFECDVWYAVNVGGGANTVTVTPGGSNASIASEVYEYSGMIAQIPAQADVTTSGTGTSATASATAISPMAPNAVMIAAVGVGTGAQTITPNATCPACFTNDSGQQNPGTPAGLFSFVGMSVQLDDEQAVQPSATFTSEPWALVAAVFHAPIFPVGGTVRLTDGTNAVGVTSSNAAKIDITSVAGTATSTGNGTSNAGNARVNIASDNTAFETIPVPTATAADTTSRCTLVSAASTNATNCKGSAGNVYGYRFVNTTTTIYYLRMYNSSSSPTCSSATGFVETIPIPPAGSAGQAGGIVSMEPFGEGYSTGISFCFTGGSSSTDNTNAATGVFGTILYK